MTEEEAKSMGDLFPDLGPEAPVISGIAHDRSEALALSCLILLTILSVIRVRFGLAQSMFGSVRGSTPSGTTNVPGRRENEERTCSGMLKR